ncbi:MAG: 2-dehydropantoate 2-reductase [Alphaproteobacteria bacterium]
MKICIYGAGAIGGYLGAGLAHAGAAVSLVARGPHLAAIQDHGLTLIKDSETTTAPIQATDDPATLGVQDYVIVSLKAHSVIPALDQIATLIGPSTAVVWAVNGIPWWYFHELEGPWRDARLRSLDPSDAQWRALRPERMIGCVVYPACEVSAPGVITHVEGDRFSLGEPSGARTDRVVALSKALIAGGFKAPVRPRIRDEIWIKLWGNLSFNPVSALTHATLEEIGGNPDTRAVVRAMMVEAQTVAEKLGITFAIDVDKRIAGAVAVGAHRTSMLQDLERGRPMEIDALVAVVQELARLTKTPSPTIDTVLALVQERALQAGLYTPRDATVSERP